MQDENAFVVDGAGHGDFAFDVDQAFVAGVAARAHAHGHAKAPVTQVDLAQAVELANGRAVQGDELLAFGDGLAHAQFRIVVALGACAQRRVHVAGLDGAAAATAAPERRAFAHQGFGAGEEGALARLVVDLAVRVLQDACHRGGAAVRQPALATDVRHQHRRALARGIAGQKALGKVHLDTKAAGKFGVALLHRVVLLDRGNEHDLDVRVHGLRLQRNGGHGHECGAGFVDLHPPAAQEAAQALPDQLVGQQIAQVQQQEAAMRPEQAAGADAGKVGDHHILVGLVVDGAKQGVRHRVFFHQHGRAVARGVVHHQVDGVMPEQLLQGIAPVGVGFAVVIGNEQLQVFEHVVLDLLQVAAQLHRVLDLFFQAQADLLHAVVEQWFDHLPPQCRQCLLHAVLQRAHGFEETRNFGPQCAFGLFDFAAALFGQGARLGLGVGVPLVAEQGEDQLTVLPKQAEVARFGKGIQGGIGLGLVLLVGVLDALGFGLAVAAGQAQGNFALQRLAECLHEGAQLAPLAWRHAQCARAFGGLEVVQVAQVRRHGAVGGHGLHGLLHQR